MPAIDQAEAQALRPGMGRKLPLHCGGPQWCQSGKRVVHATKEGSGRRSTVDGETTDFLAISNVH